MPDVGEHLRRGLAIERRLAHVFDDADDFPEPGIVSDVDLDADRVLVRLFASRGGLAGQLFGVTPRDPAAIAAALAELGIVAFAAGWVPARQASRIDPVRALRAE